MKIHPHWVCIEGPDGVGKSTVAKELAKLLPNAIITEEPHGSELGEAVYNISTEDVDNRSRALFFGGLVRATYQNTIYPALRKGKYVISVRSFPSTYVYQGRGDGNEDFVKKMFRLISRDLKYKPMVCVLEASIDVLKNRFAKREGENACQDEVEDICRLRTRYAECAKDYGWYVIAANEGPETVASDIKGLLDAHEYLDRRVSH